MDMSERFMEMFTYISNNPAALFQVSKDAVLYYFMILGVIGFSLFFIIFEAKMKPKAQKQAEARFMSPEDIAKYMKKFVYNPKYGPKEKIIDDYEADGSKNGKKVFKKEPSAPVKEECLKQAMIVSHSLYLSFDNNWARKNTNALIIGTAGSGKSRYYVGPNLLNASTNYIVTDPSGDLYRQYAKFLENEGYDVKKLDLNDMFDSERYNPLCYIEDEKDVFTLVNMLTENMNAQSGGANKEEPIWKNSKEALLRATIFYLWEYEPDPNKKTLTNVLKLINSAKINDEDEDDYENPFDQIFQKIKQIDPDSQAVTQYDIFQSAGVGKTRDSILITTTTQLSLFGSSNIEHLTSKDEMDLRTFADKKCALFLCIPTEDNTFNFLASLLYSQLFLMLYNYAEKRTQFSQHICTRYTENGVYHDENVKIFQAEDEEDMKRARKEAEALLEKIKKGLVVEYSEAKDLYYIKTEKGEKGEIIAWRGTKEAAEEQRRIIEKYSTIRNGDPMRLPEHCHFILDEFANTGKIPTFCEKLSTIRKYRMNCSIIVQSPDQLKNMYEKEMNVIVDNCNVKLFLGTNSYETAKWVSDMLGKKEITTRNENWSSGNNNGSEGFNKTAIELLSPDKVLGLQPNECIAMVYGNNNIKEPKYEITEHPNYKIAHALDGKYKANRQKRVTNNIDKSKLFSETVLPSESKSREQEVDEKEKSMQQRELGSEVLIDAWEQSLIEESVRKERESYASKKNAKKDRTNEGVDPLFMKGENKFIKETNSENVSVEEMKAKIESSSAITDYGPEEFMFDSSDN